MTIKEFKDKLAEEIRNKLRKNDTPTPILDRLELHVKDFEGVSVQDIIGSKNMRHDVYVSFIYQICYPSRIKMDIDENYQPITKKRIAIVGCKSQKQNYTCSADEMYSPSPTYRTQREFFLKGYDDWYIMSSKYGLIHHKQIIKPYNNTVGKTGAHHKKENIIQGWDPQIIEDTNERIKWMVNTKGWEVDLHISMNYYKPLLKETKSICRHIPQPMGAGTPISKYLSCVDMLDDKSNSFDEILKFISKRPDKDPEQDQWWYHPNNPPFFGTSAKIATKYKSEGIQAGNTYNVVVGKVTQHKGWVVDESLLPNLYQTDSGQWRIKKQN